MSFSSSSSLEGSSLNLEGLIFSCSHLIFSYYGSIFILCVLFQSLLKVITSFWHTFLKWMNPMILGVHLRWLPQLLHSPASSCSLIWDTLVKYDCMVSAFCIFTFFNWFLKVIFWLMFFHSNSLLKESNISFSVFRGDTYGTRWSMIESTMIFLALTMFFLCKALSLISLSKWNLSTCVGVQFIFFRGNFNSTWAS